MCTTCGCPSEPGSPDAHGQSGHRHPAPGERRKLVVETDILTKNNHIAAANRTLFAEHGIFVVNLLSSPGAGKTALLERTLSDLAGRFRCAVIEGDQQTDLDATRIAATGVPVVQVNTGAGCHLDAGMVARACERLDLNALDILFIENVGNLVCPAAFDLGEKHKALVLSVTEGEDKPLKYPPMFAAAALLLLNKTDLLPYLDFDVTACRQMARSIRPGMAILEVSARSGAGMQGWYDWLAAGRDVCRR